MNVKDTIEKRRAYRSLEPVKITEEIINDLAHESQLAPSCFNNQPWQYVFVYEQAMLKKMHVALAPGNEWAQAGSMIIAVLGKKEADCAMKDGREYYHFDIGMATAHMILRATELGLVAHPIAGYSPRKTREILGIPEDLDVITLVIVGKHSDKIGKLLSEKQAEAEKDRPARKPLKDFIHLNKY
ncbi:MAG: nitroreductase family protein [Candidatus Margulisbacteria bacterium]|nr:nitroreductase family protein [Candidatus Margulisiibacteriota bacterium]